MFCGVCSRWVRVFFGCNILSLWYFCGFLVEPFDRLCLLVRVLRVCGSRFEVG